MTECYVTKKGYQLECDKPLHRRSRGQNNNFSATYFFDDPNG